MYTVASVYIQKVHAFVQVVSKCIYAHLLVHIKRCIFTCVPLHLYMITYVYEPSFLSKSIYAFVSAFTPKTQAFIQETANFVMHFAKYTCSDMDLYIHFYYCAHRNVGVHDCKYAHMPVYMHFTNILKLPTLRQVDIFMSDICTYAKGLFM